MELFKDLDELFDIDKLDLSKEEDYQKIVDLINECKDNELFSIVGSLFGIDSDMLDNLLEDLKKNHDDLIAKNNKKEEPEKTIERPSSKIDTQVGLQIHKLVQEYIDTMVKPYNPKNGLSTDQLNDAYAGLYEFACWMFNHK